MVKRTAVLLLLLTIAAAGVRADESSSLPLRVIQTPEVQKRLAGGLTTIFLVVARNTGGKPAGASRIEVRYDLWDEVYLVKKIDFDGRIERQRIASRDALERWWRATPLRLGPMPSGADVDLTVLPFSSAEQDDARDWLSKSGGVGTPNASRGASSTLVDALIGTTISARPILIYRWKLP
jgi:hypothetical protein